MKPVPMADLTPEHFLWEVTDRIAVIRLNRPAALNALCDRLMTELGEALRERCGGDPDRLEGADVTELAQGGDLASTELLEELGTRLGHGIASVCAVLDPRIVVVGGGVSAAGELLLGPARQAFARHLIGRGHRPTPDLVLARLGNDAGVVGAAALAREHRAAGRGEG